MAAYETMTAEQYSAIYQKLRETLGRLTAERRRDLLRIYNIAADDAAKALNAVLVKGQSALTAEQLSALENLLRNSAQIVAQGTHDIMVQSLAEGSGYIGGIEKAYLTGAFAEAGMTINGLDAMIYGVNQSVISATVNRIYADGYTFSQKVWGQFDLAGKPIGVYGDWVYKIKNFTAAGIAQGIDPVKLARDLQAYITSQGGEQFFKAGRWGKLIPEAKDYIQRLGKAGVDYRALRLIRSELYSSLQTAAVEFGSRNPACTGYFKWVLQSGREKWPCRCPEFERNGPYLLNQVPGYPHPNCLCTIEPVLMNHDDFLRDLKDYKNGVSTAGSDRINEWALGNGLTVAYL